MVNKGIRCLCSVGLIVCMLLFGGYAFSARVISHSLVQEVIKQSKVEEKLQDALKSLHFPGSQKISKELTAAAEEMLNDDDVQREMNRYLTDVLSDLSGDTLSESTGHLNEAVKEKAASLANGLSDATDGLLNEQQVTSILHSALDVIDVQGLYEVSLKTMKQQLTPQQKTMVQGINFLKGDICHFTSQIGVLIFAFLILLCTRDKRKGFKQLTITWLIAAAILFVTAKTIPPILTEKLADTGIAAAVQDNVAQLERLSILCFGIGIALIAIYIPVYLLSKRKQPVS